MHFEPINFKKLENYYLKQNVKGRQKKKADSSKVIKEGYSQKKWALQEGLFSDVNLTSDALDLKLMNHSSVIKNNSKYSMGLGSNNEMFYDNFLQKLQGENNQKRKEKLMKKRALEQQNDMTNNELYIPTKSNDQNQTKQRDELVTISDTSYSKVPKEKKKTKVEFLNIVVKDLGKGDGPKTVTNKDSKSVANKDWKSVLEKSAIVHTDENKKGDNFDKSVKISVPEEIMRNSLDNPNNINAGTIEAKSQFKLPLISDKQGHSKQAKQIGLTPEQEKERRKSKRRNEKHPSAIFKDKEKKDNALQSNLLNQNLDMVSVQNNSVFDNTKVNSQMVINNGVIHRGYSGYSSNKKTRCGCLSFF